MVKVSFARMIQLGLMLSALLTSVYGQSSTQSNTQPNTQSKTERTRNQTTSQATASQPDNDTVMHLLEMNVADRDLGKMAAKKARNPRVKEFGNMMVRDHSQALIKIHALKGAPATDPKPNAKHQELMDRLSKLSGPEFDREYIDAMVMGHQDGANYLEGLTGNDPAAKLGKELLPVVRKHLEAAQQIQKELQKRPTS